LSKIHQVVTGASPYVVAMIFALLLAKRIRNDPAKAITQLIKK
jgi:hypothetical protein